MITEVTHPAVDKKGRRWEGLYRVTFSADDSTFLADTTGEIAMIARKAFGACMIAPDTVGMVVYVPAPDLFDWLP
jgi:hypothetical protein